MASRNRGSSPGTSGYTHSQIATFFLGPKAENAEFLASCLKLIASKQLEGRTKYSFPDDEEAIPPGLQQDPLYRRQQGVTFERLRKFLDHLNTRSIPFYSPRYSGHMSVDQNMTAILGYLATMFFNPNNVAFEASPFTTPMEIKVGEQLCHMLGFNASEDADPKAWGHITCDGTVANLETFWAARNLKFYVLSLRAGMVGDGPLSFIAPSFHIETCQGWKKLLVECDTWEMLNIKPQNILEIPGRLQAEYGISAAFLESVLRQYGVQTVGKDKIMRQWGIASEPAAFAPVTQHYSLPKSAAILGVGSLNLISVQVDKDAKMSLQDLVVQLDRCLREKRAVYMVIAVMGTTEEGAVDPLKAIIELRNIYQRDKGLSFIVHADAAWGGYFASMIPRHEPFTSIPDVPSVPLRSTVLDELRAMENADSITIDPHKAGYIPYPAGSLCYRDGRSRYLLTWTAPYIDQNSEGGESIGLYGVEGSKPGAAVVAVYFAHTALKPEPEGYGKLLGEAIWTSQRFSAHWAAMSAQSSPYIVVPFNPLPSEVEAGATAQSIETEKQYIRDYILNESNETIKCNQTSMELLHQLGSDLNINIFACNFRYPEPNGPGKVNTDVGEANWLNREILKEFSVTDAKKDPLKVPFYLTGTVFEQKTYGNCATHLKKRLGLEGNQDLLVLRNVVMSPFTTTANFVRILADTFRKVLESKVQAVIDRNTVKPDKHVFIMQHVSDGLAYLVYRPRFHTASGRFQLILSAQWEVEQSAPSGERADHQNIAATPRGYAHHFVENLNPMYLDEITNGSPFRALLKIDNQAVGITVRVVKIVKKRSLSTADLDTKYPRLMPFYCYGTQKNLHIDHVLHVAPNIQLGADVSWEGPDLDADLQNGVIVVAKDVVEKAMHPFPSMTSFHHGDAPPSIPSTFFFQQGKQLQVDIYN